MNQNKTQWPKIEVRGWHTASHSYKTRIMERPQAEALMTRLMKKKNKEGRACATREHTTATFDQLSAGSIVGVQPLGSETHFRLYTLEDSIRDAAPELFSAAKKTLAFINDLSKSNPGFLGKLVLQDYAQWNEAMIELPAAIAKAERKTVLPPPQRRMRAQDLQRAVDATSEKMRGGARRA